MNEEHDLIDVEAFLPGIQVYVPDAPEALLRLHLLQALRRFCVLSRYWRTPMADVLVIEGVEEYPVDAPSGTDLIAVTKVLDEQGEEVVRRNKAERLENWYWQSQPAYIQFGGELNDQTVKIYGAVQPNGSQVAEAIFSDYLEAIEQGTLARLYRMSGKPWSDPQLSQLGDAILERDAREANRRAARGFSTAPEKYQPKVRDYFL